jgi:4-hydroxy-2-oxoglutarate aldolase
MLLEGLHIPLTTPFHRDGRLNLHKLASNIARYSKTPAAGLILLAPSAEPSLLSDDETRDLLRTAAQSAAPEKVLIAGISRDSVHSTLALADFTATQHYDAILIPSPSIPTTQPELLTWFQTIADHSPIPLILLTTPTRALTLNAIATLATHPNILGLLTTDPAANIASILARTATSRREVTVTPTFLPVTQRMQQAAAASHSPSTLISAASLTGVATAVAEPPPISPPLRTRTKSVGFQIISAHTPTLLASLQSGATSIAPAFAACAPQASYEVFAAWKDSDQPLTEEKQLRILEAAQLAEASPAALKHAADLNGYFGGPPRLPHFPLTAAQRTAVEQAMHPLRN